MPRQTAQIFACGTGHTPDRAVAFRVLSGPGVPRCKTGNGRQPFRGVSNFLAPRRQSRRSWIWGCGAAEGIGSETSSHGPTFPMALVARSSRHATGDRWQRPAGAIAKAKLTELDMGLRCGRRYMVGNFQPWLCIPRSVVCTFFAPCNRQRASMSRGRSSPKVKPASGRSEREIRVLAAGRPGRRSRSPCSRGRACSQPQER